MGAIKRRRMIDTRIVSSLQFLNMGKAAQALYMHLNANADDDGVCEAGVILRATRTRKSALNELIENGFVTLLERSQNIVWMTNWQSYNTSDARYGQPSIYRQTLQEQFPNIKLVDFKAKNTSLHASNSRRVRSELESEVELEKEESQSCKLSREETDDNSVQQQTQTTTDDFCFSEIPTREEVYEYLMRFVFYDTWGIDASKQTDKFIQYNADRNWRGLQKYTASELLELFIARDESMSKLRRQYKAQSRSNAYNSIEDLTQAEFWCTDIPSLIEQHYKANNLVFSGDQSVVDFYNDMMRQGYEGVDVRQLLLDEIFE